MKFQSHIWTKSLGIKDLGELHYFLGFEVNYTSDGIILSQQKFTKELLEEATLPKPKSVAGPLPLHLKLSAMMVLCTQIQRSIEV